MKKSLTRTIALLGAVVLTVAAASVALAQPRAGAQRSDAAAEGWRAERRGNVEPGERPGLQAQRPGSQAPRPGIGPQVGPGDGPQLPGPGLHPFWENERIAEELSLTEEQVAALDESLALTKDAIEANREAARAAAEALREEMEKDNPDLATVYSLHDAVAAERTAIARATLGHAVTVKTVLTAEQEETLKASRPERPLLRERAGVGDEQREELRTRAGDRPVDREEMRARMLERRGDESPRPRRLAPEQ